VRIRLDKIASSTRNVELHRDVIVGTEIPAEPGTVVAVRVLDTKSTYNKVEDPHGRLMRVQRGDVVAGVLGARRALRGYAGVVPETVLAGDTLHLLNLGAVIGRCTSANPDVGPPCRVEVLGAVLRFPELGRRVGVPANIFPGPVALADTLPAGSPPVVLVAGSCMHAGKTSAACLLVREATARGMKVVVAKVTGVALRSDTLEMSDHGAVDAVTFTDAGFPSTVEGVPVERIARGCIAHVARHKPDLVVVELGDGILGDYGVAEILRDPAIRGLRGALMFAANDPVAAWGGVQWLERPENGGWRPAAITGPATDNESGSARIAKMCGIPAVNARTQPIELADAVLGAIAGPITGAPA
jgi:hypothetical protein